jgi:hypothetical protein
VSVPEPVEEVVDGVPVLAGERSLERARPALSPVVVQAAAVGAASFVAGAAAIAFVKGGGARRARRRRRRALGSVAGTRSFLVDVHVLDRR